jgi:hypothetical protein
MSAQDKDKDEVTLPPALYYLALAIWRADRALYEARCLGLLTDDEDEDIAETLAHLYKALEAVQSRHMGRRYDALEEAGLV